MKTTIQVITMLASLSIGGGRCAFAEDSATSPSNAGKSAPEFQALGPGEYNNWIETGVGGVFSKGNKAQLQQRLGLPGAAFGGITDFHWEQPVGKRGTFSMDGRGIFDNHNYLLKLRLDEPDKGYLEFGYREFRTWYDGSGGFFPRGTNHWFGLYDDELHVDRGELWFEAGVRYPDMPQVTFRFLHGFRRGMKDSTIWGDSIRTGVPPPNNSRGFAPTFLKLDEQRDSFALDVGHKLLRTEFGVGLRYDHVENDDSRNIHRRPGELTGSVAAAADRYVTQREEFESDMINAHAFTLTRFNDQVMLTTGGSYTRLDTSVGGSRIYGADYEAVYDPIFARRQFRDEGFLDLAGGSGVDQYVGNLNLMYTPWASLVVVPSFRLEHQDQAGFADFAQTSFSSARVATREDLMNTRDYEFTDVSEALELRSTGITNWVFYARGEWLEGQGNLRERQGETDPDVPAAIIQRKTDSRRFTQKYLVGANWYPHRRVNLGGQYYHKVRANDYTHDVDLTPNAPPSGNRYPAFLTAQDFTTDDVNFRFTLRPLNSLTFVSRYDFQWSTVRTKGDFLDRVQSGETTSHIFSESVSWAPIARLYLQGSVNYALDTTQSPPDGFSGAATNNLWAASKNNYWNVSTLAGYALSDRTDVQLQYSYYLAKNYVDNSLYSMPYGASAEEHRVTATLNHQLNKRVRVSLKYGFFNYAAPTFGGRNNYEAHLVYGSMQYRF